MTYILGLTKEEWERLKYLQKEYNIRQSKIIQKMEEKDDNDTPQDKEAS